MSTKPMFQCPNCQRLFSKQRSLKLHLPSCWRMQVAVEDSHNKINHHPLRPSHYNDNGSSSNHNEYSYGAINDNSNDESVASNFILSIHPAPQMILITSTGSLRITKKHYNNRVQQLRNYKSSSWSITTKHHSNYMMVLSICLTSTCRPIISTDMPD